MENLLPIYKFQLKPHLHILWERSFHSKLKNYCSLNITFGICLLHLARNNLQIKKTVISFPYGKINPHMGSMMESYYPVNSNGMNFLIWMPIEICYIYIIYKNLSDIRMELCINLHIFRNSLILDNMFIFKVHLVKWGNYFEMLYSRVRISNLILKKAF